MKTQFCAQYMQYAGENLDDKTISVDLVSQCIEKLNKGKAHTHTHTHLTALFPGQPGWAGTRKVQPIWISLKQDTVSGSGIKWAYASLHLAPDR